MKMELNEFSEEALKKEISRRRKLRDSGLCDFCGSRLIISRR